MRLCSHHNFSFVIAINEMEQNELAYKDEDGFPKGQLVDGIIKKIFLDDINVAKKKCKLIYADTNGNYISENNSYTGSMGLVINGKAHFNLRPVDYYFPFKNNELIVEYTQPIGNVYAYSFQVINEIELNEKSNLLDFLMIKTDFLMIIIFSFIIYSLFLNSKTIKFLNLSKFFSRKIFNYFYLTSIIFLFFIHIFFNVNLNTKNLIVDKNDLLATKNQILETNKESCFFEDGKSFDYFRDSLIGSEIWKIYEKRNKNDLCLLYNGTKLGNIVTRDLNKIFLVAYDFSIQMLSKGSHYLFKKNTFLSDDNPLFEHAKAIIFDKNLSEKIKKHLNLVSYSYITYGFTGKILNELSDISSSYIITKTNFDDQWLLYRSLNEYVNNYTFIAPLSFERLNFLFRIYFGFVFFIFLTVILSFYLTKFTKICWLVVEKRLLKFV